MQSQVPLKWRAKALSKVDALVDGVRVFCGIRNSNTNRSASDTNYQDVTTGILISAGLMMTLVS